MNQAKQQNKVSYQETRTTTSEVSKLTSNNTANDSEVHLDSADFPARDDADRSEVLTQMLNSGDREILEIVARDFTQVMLEKARRTFGNRADAMDAVQNVHLGLARGIGGLRHANETPFVSYLLRSIANESRVEYRKAQSRARVSDSIRNSLSIGSRGLSTSPEQHYDLAEQLEVLDSALDAMNPALSAIIKGRLKNQTFKEIASDLSESEQAVKMRFYRGVEMFVHILEEKGFDFQGWKKPLFIEDQTTSKR